MQETLIGSSAYCLRAWNPAGIRGLDGVTVHDMTPVRRKAELPRFILPPGLWHNGFHMLNLQRALALKGAASTSLTYAPQASTTAHYAQNLADVAKLHPDEDRIVAGHSNGGLIMFPASEQLLAGDLRKKTKGFAFINSVIPSQFRQGLTVGLAKTGLQKPGLSGGHPSTAKKWWRECPCPVSMMKFIR